MRNTKKLLLLVLIALSFSSCSQQSEAYNEDVALEENYDYDESRILESQNGESLTEKVVTEELYDDNNKDQGIAGNGSQTLAYSQEQKSYIPKPKENEAIISSKGLTNPYKDKKFIKTANIIFSVEDVYQSTVAIEEILLANDGFLINSNLYTEVVRSQTFSKTEEMDVRVEEFETRNNITIRVPSANLHETLLAIADEMVFLDSRMIDADDVGLKLLAEELEQKRNAKSAQNLQNQINNGGKLGDKVYAEQLTFERATQKDLAFLKELSIEDKVEYSTITISIYQNTELRTQEIPNFSSYTSQFEPSYGSELLAALGTSIDLIKGVFTFILSVWPVLLVLFIGGVIFKRTFFKV